MLEPCDFRVFLGGMNEDLFAEISICDCSDDCTDFSQHLLVRCVDLCILLNLALELIYRLRIAQSVERGLGCALLMRELCFDSVNEILLAPNLFSLLVDVLS